MLALPSFWSGLLYDSAALDAAWEIARQWSPEDRGRLHTDVLRHGLWARIRGQSVADIAGKLSGLSRQGLQRRARFDGGGDESHYLNPLFDIIDRKENRADALLKQFGGGKFDAKRLFAACRLIPY